MQKLKNVIPLILILLSCFAATKVFALKIRYSVICFDTTGTACDLNASYHIKIGCDSVIIIPVLVGYLKEKGDSYPDQKLIKIFDVYNLDSYPFIKDNFISTLLGAAILTVDSTDPEFGSKILYFRFKCNPQNPNGKCKLTGNNDSSKHESPNTLFLYPGGWEKDYYVTGPVLPQPTDRIDCEKQNRAWVTILPTGPGYISSEDTLPITVSSPIDSLGGGNLYVTYDSNYFNLANAYFNSAFSPGIAEGLIDSSIHGDIAFHFSFLSHQIIDTNGMQMGTLVLKPKTTTPYGRYLVAIDPSSQFLSPTLTFVDAHLGSEFIVVIPFDTTAPVINCSMITTTPTSLTGSAGAIFDDFISTPDYVVAALYKIDSGNVDTAWEGGRDTVNADGSFTIPDIIINNFDTLFLIAIDGAGNVGTCKWVAQVSAVPGISNNNNKIKVYPTLMNDKLQVSSTYQTSLRVIIYDVLGRKWVNEDVRSGNTSIDVSNLVNGVYEVVVMDNSGAALLEQKVVKQ